VHATSGYVRLAGESLQFPLHHNVTVNRVRGSSVEGAKLDGSVRALARFLGRSLEGKSGSPR
jgi:hypothetical protein